MTTSLPTLARLSAGIGVPLDEQALERFGAYRDLLLDWNQRVNLTRVTEPEEMEIKLFLDALVLLPWIQRHREHSGASPAARVIDVGAGAGFPGLPLKIADPSLDLVLIDATNKKVTFLLAAIAELGLTGARAIHGRAEELAHDPTYRARFDIATARAVARLPGLLELCLPFCVPGGLGLFPKGRDAQAEADESRRALRLLKATLVSVEPAPVAELAGSSLVVVAQRAPVPPAYPRRVGVPIHDPL